MNMVANETSIIYTNSGTDPYTNNDGFAMLGENQTSLDSVILSANYDIGHVFSTGGGGIAGLGVICQAGQKGQGVTGSSNPIGDGFDVDYVAHEMGHQFGANHTFNGTLLNCGGGNRNSATAYEPGSGSTIMGYAGICGAQNLQLHSDGYFHVASLSEFQAAFTAEGSTDSCAAATGSGNTPPTVNPGTGTLNVPKQTPFTLTATGSDANGDTLTYTWEELDLGSSSPPDDDVNAVRPILRSFLPSTSPSRTFPQLADILSNTPSYGESLPTRTRSMQFRVTARDNHAGAGGTTTGARSVSVTSTAGPFKVTAPAAGAVWGFGSTETVTWNVAGTTASPISAASVKISLSTDGGNTFPVVLLASTPNDGSAPVTVPSTATTQARVKVEAVGKVFFDISHADFSMVPAVLSIGDANVTEGNSGNANAVFTVTLAPSSLSTVTVAYATARGTAASGTDFVAATGILTFSPGITTQTLAVAAKGDLSYEADETFVVNLGAHTNAGVVDGQGTGTITNDDAPPSLSIGDVSSYEGNTGTKNFVFTVTLTPAAGLPANVAYSTADGTATVAAGDFITGSGTLAFAPGTTARTLAVQVKGDTVFEGDETFLVNLMSPVQATILDNQGVGTILEDDAAGTFQFGAANFVVSEAATSAIIKVTRTSGLAGGVTVTYLPSDGSATLGADYTGASGVLTFAAYQTVATFSLGIVRDSNDELDETVLLRLASPTGPLAMLGPQDTAVLTITDNDAGGKLSFSAAAYSVNEPGAATISVRRSGGIAGGVTVDYTTGGGTAVAGTDYTTAAGTLTFGPGIATQTFAVQTLPDGFVEGNKTIALTLSPPMGGASLGTTSAAVLTIVEDDPSVQFSLAAYSVSEASPRAVITVKRTGPLTATANVDYTTSDGSANVGSDYLLSSGTLTFTPGITTRTFGVTLLPDTLVEGNQTVNLTLSGTVNASVGTPASALLTITENDVQQKLQFSAASYNGSEAAPKAVITVKRTGSAVGTVYVDYATSDGALSPAAAGVDYGSAAGTLTFTPGATTRTFAVAILPDLLDEGTETVDLALSNPVGAIVGAPATATLNILDNEPTLQFSTAKYTAAETAAKATITVRRTGSTLGTVYVDYTTSDGTATAGADYTTSSGTLTFGPGIASRTFAVLITNDLVDEPAEIVNLALSNASGAALGTPSTSVLTVTDNDLAGKAQFSAASYSVAESHPQAIVTATRSGGTSGGATVDYTTSDGTAADGLDYTLSSGTLTFGVGESTKTFAVAILDNGAGAANLSLGLTLGNPGGNLVLGTQKTATLWIVQ
jgi:hypothetical protein